MLQTLCALSGARPARGFWSLGRGSRKASCFEIGQEHMNRDTQYQSLNTEHGYKYAVSQICEDRATYRHEYIDINVKIRTTVQVPL